MSLLKKLMDFKKSWEYLAEGLKIDFSGIVFDFMQREKINRVELANRMNVSAAYITKILSGTANPSIETMSKVAHALNAEVNISFKSVNEKINKNSKTISSNTEYNPEFLWIANEAQKQENICIEGVLSNEHRDNEVAA